jgi:hypothetical protein
MDLIWLVPLTLGALFAISGGSQLKWRFLNFAIIAGCMLVGFGIGYAAGLASQNLWHIPDAAWPLAEMFGIVAALGCVQLNSLRARKVS